MISRAAAAVFSVFPPGRVPSQADASVPYQDPQNDGQKPFKPRALPAAAAAHQEVPAAPELTTRSFGRAHTAQSSFSLNSSRTICGPDMVITVL